MGSIKVVHYINQFYGGIGGEDKADYRPELREGPVGPGLALSQNFKGEATIVATLICGDSYFNENVDEATETLLALMKDYEPDVFIAGPAFNAGRYGMACGTICEKVKEKLGIPVVSAMYNENPGVDSFAKSIYVLQTGNSAAAMRTAAPKLANFSLKLARGKEILSAREEGYFPTGVRKNLFVEDRGSKRAVDMLIKKINNEAFDTEFEMPVFDHVEPNPAIKDIKHAKIALVTSGGIVPKGNPDKIESSSASKYGKYDISMFDDLTEATHETAHGGYDPVYANRDSDVVLPVDVLREMEQSGEIGSLHQYFYTTTGNGTSVASSKAFAAEFAVELRNDGVQAVILTST